MAAYSYGVSGVGRRVVAQVPTWVMRHSLVARPLKLWPHIVMACIGIKGCHSIPARRKCSWLRAYQRAKPGALKFQLLRYPERRFHVFIYVFIRFFIVLFIVFNLCIYSGPADGVPRAAIAEVSTLSTFGSAEAHRRPPSAGSGHRTKKIKKWKRMRDRPDES